MDLADDKEHSAPGSLPVLSFSTKSGRSLSALNLTKVIPVCALLGLVLLYANLVVACMTNFTCERFLPTPDYLGCFRGFDRLHIVTATYAAVVFGVVLVGVMSRVRAVVGGTRRAIMLVTGVCVFLSLPLSSLTDEVNAVHSFPMEKTHSLMNRSLLVAGPIWVLAAYSSISLLHSMLNSVEKRWFLVLRILVVGMGAMGIAAILEAQFAYSAYTSKYVNENVESGLEWALAGLSWVLLAVLSQFTRGFALRFSVQSSSDADTEKSEVELTKV